MKRAIKVLTTSESLISLVMIFGQIPVMIISGKAVIIFIAIVLMMFGLVLIYLIVKKNLKSIDYQFKSKLSSIEIKTRISTYIQNPKTQFEFKKSKFYNPFKGLSLESEFYFIKLSSVFPDLPCSELKTLIENSLNEHH